MSKVEAGRSPHQLVTKATILWKKMMMRGTYLSFAAQKEMKNNRKRIHFVLATLLSGVVKVELAPRDCMDETKW